jgi:hypothetical protein
MTPAQIAADFPFRISKILPEAQRLRPVAEDLLKEELNELQRNFDEDRGGYAAPVGCWLARMGRVDDARKLLQWGITKHQGSAAADACRAQLVEIDDDVVPDAPTQTAAKEWVANVLNRAHDDEDYSDPFDRMAETGGRPTWQAFSAYLDLTPELVNSFQLPEHILHPPTDLDQVD